MEIPKYAGLTRKDSISINYLCNIRDNKDYNIKYFEDRKYVVIRNCDESGNLCDLKLPKYKYSKSDPWVLLKVRDFTEKVCLIIYLYFLMVFTLQGEVYQVPVCLTCNDQLSCITTEQDRNSIGRLLCHHAKVSANIIRDFKNPIALDGWLELSEDEDDTANSTNIEIIHKKEDRRSSTQHLAVVFFKRKVSLLYTTGKQVTPTCSSCSSVSCQCVRSWKKHLNDASVDEPIVNNIEETEEVMKGEAHYKDKEAQYGHNETHIKFPLPSCPDQKSVLEKIHDGTFGLPSSLIPIFDPLKVCRLHGNAFKENDDHMKVCAKEVIVYHERGETVYDCTVYYRDTDARCKCRQNYDGHEYLIFHMGGGKMVDYITLQSYLISMVNSGSTAYSYHKTIKDLCQSLGNNFSCSYQTFLEACDGFVNNLKFDLKVCFSCTNCGISPKYFVGDGKADIAPLQRKLKANNVSELSSHPEDKNILSQGSKHTDRLFLYIKSERDILCKLLTESVTVTDFCNSENFESENGELIHIVIRRLSVDYPSILPEPYKIFLTDVGKGSPVAGFIQVTSKKPLVQLRQFCNREIDLRNGNYQQELAELKSQLPALWQQLMDICILENSNFLPLDIANIVIRLLSIRRNTFRNGPQRYAEDYIKYDTRENQTQFYPNHELKTYPKRYNVSKKVDEDFCEKNFPKHHDFADGIFSIGCSCNLSITYGFEIMMAHESARHFFKFLMNRKLNLKNLEGVIFDFACGLHRYALNREPLDFEHLRFLVDGSHWQNQKRLKKQDSRSKKGGHLGCSTGYNFNIYKEHTKVSVDGAKNSQGREQMHSVLDKLAKSFRQKNYHNFMRYMIAFFAVRNLMVMKKL